MGGPELVGEVVFHGWTTDGVMRQPVFMRIRDDTAGPGVMREEPPAPVKRVEARDENT